MLETSMNTKSIAINIALEKAHHMSQVRLEPGLVVAQVGKSSVWIKGKMSDALVEQVRAIPGLSCFHILSDQQLVRFGNRVPSSQLPNADWVPIAIWFAPQLPVGAFPACLPRKTSLRLRRGGSPSDPNVVLCSLDDWHAYATTAPQARLDRLYFACNAESREVIVHGAPMPPVRGRYFVERENVAIEAGWTLSPRVDEPTVRQMLHLATNSVAIIKADGTWEKIDESDFVKARRSAVRMTYEKASR